MANCNKHDCLEVFEFNYKHIYHLNELNIHLGCDLTMFLSLF